MTKSSELKTNTKIVTKDKGSFLQELDADICVVGAGISGISAAIEAARLGRRVVLVDSLPVLGGQAVNGIIGAFCGLFANGPNGYQLTHGIADDILRELGKQGMLHYRRNGKWTTVMYDEVALSRWVDNAILESGVTPLLGAVLRGVEREGRRIKSIDLSTRFGDLRIHAKGFVDASGDAALTWHAGLPCREPENATVYGTLMVVLEGVNNEKQPARELVVERLHENATHYGFMRRDGFAFAFPGRGLALVNMTHVETPLDPVKASVKSLEGKNQADKAVQFLKGEFPEAFSSASVRSYGQLGIRQTRWIVGSKHLTVDEVRAGTRFEDAVARTAWAIELHDREEGYVWEEFPEDHLHYVPLGSMIPPDADNLVAAGRCIDADVAALSSVRVMGPCIAMGAAAAHALDLAGEGSVHQIDLKAFSERIKDNVERTD